MSTGLLSLSVPESISAAIEKACVCVCSDQVQRPFGLAVVTFLSRVCLNLR